MKVVVIGATGTIGSAIVNKLKTENCDVIAVSRSSSPALDIESPESIDAFYSKLSPVDAIVCAAGNAAFGALGKLTDEQLSLSVQSKLLGEVNVVRKGLSLLKPSGSFVLTGGMLAYSPWPETSMVAAVNAALEGFAKAVALELTEERSISVVHPPLVQETAQAMGMDAAPWPSADQVADAYWTAITSKTNGKPVFVEGYKP